MVLSEELLPLAGYGSKDAGYMDTEYETYETSSVTLKHKKTYDEILDLVGVGKFHWLLLLGLGWSNVCDAVEVLCVSFMLPAAECELGLTSANKGWLGASTFIGMMAGGYPMATLADVTGRRRVLILSLFINGTFGALSSFAQSYWLFFILRVLSGFGVGGNFPVVWSYYAEFQPKKARGRMLSYLATFWVIGNILVAVVGWAVIPRKQLNFVSPVFSFTSWRIFTLLCTVPAFTAVMPVWCLPESPKYFHERGKDKLCMETLEKIYNFNKKANTKNYVHFDKIELMCCSDFCPNPKGSRRELKSKYSIICACAPKAKELFHPSLCRFTFVWITVNFTLAFSFYGLWMWFPELFKRLYAHDEDVGKNATICNSAAVFKNHTSKIISSENCTEIVTNSSVYLNTVFLALANIPGNLLSILLMDRVKRRLMLGVAMTTCAIITFFIWFVTSSLQNLILSCAFAAMSVLSWNTLEVLGSEIFPTPVKATAFGLAQVFGRTGAILGNISFGHLIDKNCFLPMILMTISLVGGGLTGLLFPNPENVV